MKSELRSNPKFKRLCRVVGLPGSYVAGLLEYLWQVGYEQASEIIGDAIDVECASDWPGEVGAWAKALHEGGWLDDVGGGRFAIHDFWDHAPQYVERKAKRKNEKTERKASWRLVNGNEKRPPDSQHHAAETGGDQKSHNGIGLGMASHRLATDGENATTDQHTQPNPTQPSSAEDHGQPLAAHAEEIAEAFEERGIPVDEVGGGAPHDAGRRAAGPPAAPPVVIEPDPSPEHVRAVAAALKGTVALPRLTTAMRQTLARMCEGDGPAAVASAIREADQAQPPRIGKGFVTYVENVLAGRAAREKYGPVRTRATGSHGAVRAPLTAKVVKQ